MTPQGARAKGQRLQKWIRDLILKTWPDLEPDDVRNTASGQPGEDVQLSPAARKKVPYQIEAKNKSRSQLHTYFSQAKTHGKHEPLVIVHMDRAETLVALEANNFFNLLKQLDDYKNKQGQDGI